MTSQIFPQNLGVHSAITADMVPRDRTIRATVGMLLIDQDRVLFVHSGKAPEEKDKKWFTLPQEGVEYMDGSLRGTIVRGLNEELGLRDHHVDMRAVPFLLLFQNKIPSNRVEGGGPIVKEIAYFGIRFRGNAVRAIRPDASEVKGVTFASSWEDVDRLMETVAEHRVHKYIATCLAIRAACKAKMLPWHVPAFVDARLKTHSAQLAH